MSGIKGGGPTKLSSLCVATNSTHETRKGQTRLEVLRVRLGELYREILNHRTQ